MDRKSSFATRLGQALERAGKGKAQLADEVGVRPATVTGWFSGSLPEGASMVQLPDVLDVSGHWLLTGEGPMHADPDAASVRLEVIGKVKDGDYVGAVDDLEAILSRRRLADVADAGAHEIRGAAPGRKDEEDASSGGGRT